MKIMFWRSCVMDFEAKPGTTVLCQSLTKLGEMVMKELVAGQQADTSENLLYKAMDTYWDGSVLVDTNRGHWFIHHANESFGNMTGRAHSLLQECGASHRGPCFPGVAGVHSLHAWRAVGRLRSRSS